MPEDPQQDAEVAPANPPDINKQRIRCTKCGAGYTLHDLEVNKYYCLSKDLTPLQYMGPLRACTEYFKNKCDRKRVAFQAEVERYNEWPVQDAEFGESAGSIIKNPSE
jgi:hypothetical protein